MICSIFVLKMARKRRKPAASGRCSRTGGGLTGGRTRRSVREVKRQTACKPGSVPWVAMGMAIHLGRPLPGASRDRPGRRRENPPGPWPGPPPLRGLAPGGVYRAAPVAGGAVRSYRTLSPLPSVAEAKEGGLLSVALSLGSPPPGVTRHPVSVEPGLSSPGAIKRRRRPSGRLAILYVGIPVPWVNRDGRRRGLQSITPSTAASRRRVPASAAPVTALGRKWRWKASMTAARFSPV